MPDIYALADQFRRQLLRRERQAATELVRAYGAAWQRIRGRLDDLTAQIAQAQARGEEVSPSWLLQRERLQTLQRQVEAEIREFARYAESRIVAEQREAVQAAQEHAAELMRVGLGEPSPGVAVTFARLPAGAVQDLVGFLQDGSPLRELLDELGPEAGAALRRALITGMATGQGPPAIVRSVRQALGGNLARALTIARTEVLRSYREASRRTYEANSDVVEGWVWHAALGMGRRTCAFCWAMHGSVHPVGERMATHPRCRCGMAPRTKSWEELGFRGIRDTRPRGERGSNLFANLPEAEQLAVLGPAKLAAYRAGALKLEDLAGFRIDRRWGRVGYERSLADIVGAQEARRWLERGIAQRPLPVAGGSTIEDLRQRRIEQLRAMADVQFAAEVRRHQGSQWRAPSLENHAREHRRDFLDLLGRVLSPPELDALSREVLRTWDRLFTELDDSGAVTYVFVRLLDNPEHAILVITRGGRIRSAFPTSELTRWQERHGAVSEVTNRAKRLGLKD